MYEGLDLEAKKFSGLTDDVLGALSNISAVALGTMQTDYEELRLSFLPEDRQTLEAQITKIKSTGKALVYGARLEDFDQVFDAIVKVKHGLSIVNNALAILMMAELAVERLGEMEEAQAAEPAEPKLEAAG